MGDWIYLGIDQTGAVNSKGLPKALPACVLFENKVRFFTLPSLTRSCLESELGTHQLSTLLIAVDCVLGLPKELGLLWRQAVESTSLFPGYGRAPAQAFFRSLGKGQTPRRQVEVLCGANSVFQERPFQKNIQTGTFRIWKDLSQDFTSFYAPAIEERTHTRQIPLYEGYPSLSWRLLLNARRRSPDNLSALLKKFFPELLWTSQHQKQVDRDSNLADALLLALSMRQFCKDAIAIRRSSEGWILRSAEPSPVH